MSQPGKKQCSNPTCEAYFPVKSVKCPYCGAEYVPIRQKRQLSDSAVSNLQVRRPRLGPTSAASSSSAARRPPPRPRQRQLTDLHVAANQTTDDVASGLDAAADAPPIQLPAEESAGAVPPLAQSSAPDLLPNQHDFNDNTPQATHANTSGIPVSSSSDDHVRWQVLLQALQSSGLNLCALYDDSNTHVKCYLVADLNAQSGSYNVGVDAECVASRVLVALTPYLLRVLQADNPKHVYAVPVRFKSNEHVDYVLLCDCAEGAEACRNLDFVNPSDHMQPGELYYRSACCPPCASS